MSKTGTKWFLLAFVASAIVTQIVKSIRSVEEMNFTEGKHLVFFHAKVRCPTCIKMERLIKQILDNDFKEELQSGTFDFFILDYESPESRRIVEKYKIATATLLLFEQKDGEPSDGRNLADLCWKLVNNEPAFQKVMKTQLEDFLQGKNPVPERQTNEIELAPDLNLFEKE